MPVVTVFLYLIYTIVVLFFHYDIPGLINISTTDELEVACQCMVSSSLYRQ
jgi:hypothetical protein